MSYARSCQNPSPINVLNHLTVNVGGKARLTARKWGHIVVLSFHHGIAWGSWNSDNSAGIGFHTWDYRLKTFGDEHDLQGQCKGRWKSYGWPAFLQRLRHTVEESNQWDYLSPVPCAHWKWWDHLVAHVSFLLRRLGKCVVQISHALYEPHVDHLQAALLPRFSVHTVSVRNSTLNNVRNSPAELNVSGTHPPLPSGTHRKSCPSSLSSPRIVLSEWTYEESSPPIVPTSSSNHQLSSVHCLSSLVPWEGYYLHRGLALARYPQSSERLWLRPHQTSWIPSKQQDSCSREPGAPAVPEMVRTPPLMCVSPSSEYILDSYFHEGVCKQHHQEHWE